MYKQSALEQIREEAFQDEMEKVALSNKTIEAVGKKLDPMLGKAVATIRNISNTASSRKISRDAVRDRLFVKQNLKRLSKKIMSGTYLPII